MGLRAARPPGWDEYVPRWGGNDKDPEPCRMQIRTLPNELKAEWEMGVAFGLEAAGATNDDETNERAIIASASSPTEEMIRKILRRCVKDVENYVGDDGRPILTGDDLRRRGDSEVCLEVATTILTRTALKRLEAKNLTARPGSSPPSPPEAPEAGSATSADELAATD